MENIKLLLKQDKTNFVFLGEAGSGKSEIALNFAMLLSQVTDKVIHFFDMDMTKPLFRAREAIVELESEGIVFHFEEQFMDAPTLVGGVNKLLRDERCLVVMDVGGDHIGARSIGGFSIELNKPHTAVYYVLNAFRPWSTDIDQIDQTLVAVLHASRVNLDNVRMINNSNLGVATTMADFVEGCQKIEEIVAPYRAIEFNCINETLYEEARQKVDKNLIPLHLYLTYPWVDVE
ncbi:P-loop NTPase family protein [Fusibacter ferrireducens]|uniref:CobQ/CobB/MinD/ParA nucleotide binding domain-containing protein n=1 Tax=Fusibacter ferrireducens TaxID=2785058 RepID=A0ABR9ZW31_9FIRM|nr:hypothetical protein [Fusibacter ferrireducens]MBF4694677.1 hypothetical protein [Fusibacter ferrireducens]